jgi:uncharacterized membrane protein HdeD (DUF308 family)
MTALFLETSTSSTKEDVFIFLGFFLFLIGVVQIIGAIVRTISAIIYKKNLKLLLIYWLQVVIFIFVFYGFVKLNHDIFIWIPFAILIAIWYWVKIVFTKQTKDFFVP